MFCSSFPGPLGSVRVSKTLDQYIPVDHHAHHCPRQCPITSSGKTAECGSMRGGMQGFRSDLRKINDIMDVVSARRPWVASMSHLALDSPWLLMAVGGSILVVFSCSSQLKFRYFRYGKRVSDGFFCRDFGFDPRPCVFLCLKAWHCLALSGLSPPSFVVPLESSPLHYHFRAAHDSNDELFSIAVFLCLFLVRCGFVSAPRFVNASTVLDSVVEGAVSR